MADAPSQPFRIFLIGYDGSGKTTLVENLPHESGMYTTNIEIDSMTYQIEIFDTNWCEDYIPNLESEVPDVAGFILVFSITSRESFAKAKRLLPHIWKCKGEKWFPLVVVGNKADLKNERVVTSKEGNVLAGSWYSPYLEICAHNKQEVMRVFIQIVKEIIKPIEEQPHSGSEIQVKERNRCCSII